MEFIKFWLRQIDILWYILVAVGSPFALMWLIYLCPIVVAFWMFAWILLCCGKTILAWRLWKASNGKDVDMAGIAVQNTTKTAALVFVCVASLWLAVWATIRYGDEAGDKLCDHPESYSWFTMPRLVLHFYTPTCGPHKPSWLDKNPDEIVFGWLH